MGAFQSKKKYDVATGESTIKIRSQAPRNEGKREQLSRISQQIETLNKVNTQTFQVERNVNGLNDEDLKEEITTVSLQHEDASVLHEEVDLDSKAINAENESTLVEASQSLSNTPVEDHSQEEQLDILKSTEGSESPRPQTVQVEHHDDYVVDDKGLIVSFLNEERIASGTPLDNPKELERLSCIEPEPEELAVLNEVASSGTSTVNEETRTENAEVTFTGSIAACEKPEHEEIAANSGTNIVSEEPGATLTCEKPEHEEIAANSCTNIVSEEPGATLTCEKPDHEEIPVVNKVTSSGTNILNEEPGTTACEKPKREETTVLHEIASSGTEEPKTIISCEEPAHKQISLAALITEEPETSLAAPTETTKRARTVSFEAPPVLNEAETKETIVSSEEREAITVLNNAITEISINHEERPVVHTGSPNSHDHSRKRVVTGDPPTEEEIIKANNADQIKEPSPPSKDTLEAHKISHIYLETVNSDDVHYTLDKMHLMDEQIHTSRARIMSIKEID